MAVSLFWISIIPASHTDTSHMYGLAAQGIVIIFQHVCRAFFGHASRMFTSVTVCWWLGGLYFLLRFESFPDKMWWCSRSIQTSSWSLSAIERKRPESCEKECRPLRSILLHCVGQGHTASLYARTRAALLCRMNEKQRGGMDVLLKNRHKGVRNGPQARMFVHLTFDVMLINIKKTCFSIVF